eukprot:gb/GECG01004684.1/.p1 GENE.gb/GECG01004684.1/~~gb/GECG01004684.1/.p1  ORF type:complete len:382 (+),score=37.92 gb/GECG01004684.1/:1-1146(+)
MGLDSQEDAVLIVLLVLYVGLLGYTNYQMLRLWTRKHKIVSYRMGFCVGVALWSALRVAYWIMLLVGGDDLASSLGSMLLFWLPQAFQFGVFGLLTIFYLKLTHRSNWRRHWKVPTFTTYSIGVTILVCLEILSACFAVNSNATPSQVNSVATSGLFAVLGCSYVYFAYRIHKLKPSEYQRMFALRPTTIVVTNVVLSVVFLSRAAFDLVSGLGAVTISLPPTSAKEQAAVFAGFTGWEILPILLLFLTLATEREGREATPAPRPSFGIFGVIEEAEKETAEQGKWDFELHGKDNETNEALAENGAFTPLVRGGRSRRLNGNSLSVPPSAYSGDTESRVTSYSFVYESGDMAHAMHEALLRQQQEEDVNSVETKSQRSDNG